MTIPTSLSNGDGNLPCVASPVIVCITKSRFTSITSFLRVTSRPHAHRRQSSLFSSSVGRSVDVSFTVYRSNTPGRCEKKRPLAVLDHLQVPGVDCILCTYQDSCDRVATIRCASATSVV